MKRSSFKIVALVSLPILLASCGAMRKYDAPKLTEAQQQKLYRDANASDSTNLADLNWKDIFTDPQLQALIEEALNNNYDLRNAILQIAITEASFKQSKLALLPNLNFAPQVTHNKTSRAALNFPPSVNINLKTTTVQLGFSSNWELDVWGKLASGRRAAQANWLQADASKRAVQTSLIANIANMYYNLLALDKQLSVTEETLKLRIATVQTLQALKDAAIINGAGVVQGEANRYAAEVTIPDIKQSIRELENAMSVLLGRPMQAADRATLETSSIDATLAVGVPVQLLTKRPDVQAAELGFRKAFENTNVAKAQFYPSFTITSANAGISALTTKNLFSESIFYNFIGGLTQPIFNKGAIRANHKIAVAQQEQAWNTFEKTVLIAGQEVSNAMYAYQAAAEKQVSRTKQIAALEKAVNFNMQLLEYSSATNYTDVLTAEQSLLTAKLAGVNDKLQQQKALIELYRSLGGGWQ